MGGDCSPTTGVLNMSNRSLHSPQQVQSRAVIALREFRARVLERYTRSSDAEVCRAEDGNTHPCIDVAARRRVRGTPPLCEECRNPFVIGFSLLSQEARDTANVRDEMSSILKAFCLIKFLFRPLLSSDNLLRSRTTIGGLVCVRGANVKDTGRVLLP